MLIFFFHFHCNKMINEFILLYILFTMSKSRQIFIFPFSKQLTCLDAKIYKLIILLQVIDLVLNYKIIQISPLKIVPFKIKLVLFFRFLLFSKKRNSMICENKYNFLQKMLVYRFVYITVCLKYCCMFLMDLIIIIHIKSKFQYIPQNSGWTASR